MQGLFFSGLHLVITTNKPSSRKLADSFLETSWNWRNYFIMIKQFRGL